MFELGLAFLDTDNPININIGLKVKTFSEMTGQEIRLESVCN